MAFALRLTAALFLLGWMTVGTLFGQSYSYRVFFTDKGPEQFSPASELYRATLALHNDRCLARRAKVRVPDRLLTLDDAPLYPPYLAELEERGAHSMLQLRWLNYCVVRVDSAVAITFADLPFVRDVQRTSRRLMLVQSCLDEAETPPASDTVPDSNCGAFDYGPSFMQNLMANTLPLHAMGITGHNVLLGFIDSGYRWRMHVATTHLDVRGEYDFVFNDSVTSDQAADIEGQEGHGQLVVSIAGGFHQGQLIGTAPNAAFMLAKTENLAMESHLEEDNFAAAVEWLEAGGVDIISSSLGYLRFDEGEEDYEFEQLDGKSAIATRSLNLAADRGVMCGSSGGNAGPDASTILVPGDADSTITVASATSSGAVVRNSSRGPINKPDIKPDLAALGAGVICASGRFYDTYLSAGGTSLATPLVTGGMALMLSAFPELRPWEMRALLRGTASQSAAPDTALGYGVADIYEAMLAHDIIVTPELAVLPLLNVQRVVAFAASRHDNLRLTLRLRFAVDGLFRDYPMQRWAAGAMFFADIPRPDFGGEPAEAFVEAVDVQSQRRMPYDEKSHLSVCPDAETIPCGVARRDLPLSFPAAAREGYFPSIASSDDGTLDLLLDTPFFQAIQVDVFTVQGRHVYSTVVDRAELATTAIPIPVRALATANYLTRVSYGNRVKYFSFTVVN